MPWKEKTVEKLYWSIGEVAEELGVNTSLIRYWEKEFNSIRPKRTGKGDRSYTRKEIDQLRRIQHLVKEKGFTLQGAKEQLRGGNVPAEATSSNNKEVLERLGRIKAELLTIAENL